MVNLYDQPELEQMVLSDYTFLPSIDIRLIDSMGPVVHSILKEGTYDPDMEELIIDYNKLRDFFEIIIVQRERLQGISTFHHIKFSNCNPDDF